MKNYLAIYILKIHTSYVFHLPFLYESYVIGMHAGCFVHCHSNLKLADFISHNTSQYLIHFN